MTSQMSGTINYEVNIADLTTRNRCGEIVEIANIPWRVGVLWQKRDNADSLGVYCCCNDQSLSNLWSCNAKYDIHLMKGNEIGKSFSCQACFSNGITNRGSNGVIEKKVLVDETNGYVKNGKLVIVVNIEIKSSVGFPKVQPSDFSISQNIDSEVCLLVEGQKLYPNKHVLISFSIVFRAMLSSDIFFEKNEKLVKIDVENFEHFVLFLNILHRKPQKLTDVNVEGLLKLADKYDVQFLMDDCEKFLLNKSGVPISEMFNLAEEYKFSKLQNQLLRNIESIEQIKKVRTDMKKIGSKTAEALLNRMCSL